MELTQAIAFIKNNSISCGNKTCWADLGCGNGMFTTALANLLQPGSIIFAVDKNPNVLRQLPSLINGVIIEKVQVDFSKDLLSLTDLDGIVMANSLHFIKDKASFINKGQKWLKAEGVLLIVEYDTDTANPWVPYPVSWHTLKALFENRGYDIEKLYEYPSLFNRANIYSALIRQR